MKVPHVLENLKNLGLTLLLSLAVGCSREPLDDVGDRDESEAGLLELSESAAYDFMNELNSIGKRFRMPVKKRSGLSI